MVNYYIIYNFCKRSVTFISIITYDLSLLAIFMEKHWILYFSYYQGHLCNGGCYDFMQ